MLLPCESLRKEFGFKILASHETWARTPRKEGIEKRETRGMCRNCRTEKQEAAKPFAMTVPKA
jgi:hypothetical protein